MKRSRHSPLSHLLRRVHATCGESAATGIPVDELLAMQNAVPRRAVLLGAGAAAAAASVRPARAASSPSVVIVGAGLAGLSCARKLKQHGIIASIYEWNTRLGGRVQTLRGYFQDGINMEQHGQFISSEHARMRALAADFGLTLANVNTHLHRYPDTGWYNGQMYSQAQLIQDWQSYAYKLFHDAVLAAPGASYYHSNHQARAWDNISVTEWVQTYVPGGVDGQLGALCLADVTSEYGSPPDQQSALNLLGILGDDASRGSGYQSDKKPMVAGSDEKYQVNGGNDQIITCLVNELHDASINVGYQLLAVRPTSAGGFVSSFQNGAGTVDVRSDHVVLTLPPPTLRDVDLSKVPLAPVQKLAIAKATLGKNAKVFIQIKGRPWVANSLSGTLLTDQTICGGWDAANVQPGGYGKNPDGVWVGYPGGKPGEALATRYGLTEAAQPAPAKLVNDTLAQLEPIFPGMTAAWAAGPQLAWVNDGNIDPYLRGAYSNFLVGQYTAFAGAQSLRAGNLHFAGEHTSTEFQGYMEGAVQSGYRAAGEI